MLHSWFKLRNNAGIMGSVSTKAYIAISNTLADIIIILGSRL